MEGSLQDDRVPIRRQNISILCQMARRLEGGVPSKILICLNDSQEVHEDLCPDPDEDTPVACAMNPHWSKLQERLLPY